MNPDPTLPPRLAELLELLCEQRISDAQFAELDSLLSSSEQATRHYVRYLGIHANLLESHSHAVTLEDLNPSRQDSEAVVDDLVPEGLLQEASEQELVISTENILAMLEEEAAVAQREAVERARIESLAAEKFLAFRREQDRQRRPEPVAVPRNVFYATVTSLAAAAIIGILLLVGRDAEPIVVAKIVGTSSPVWGDEGTAMPPATNLHEGQLLDLVAGLLEIEFGNGARVVLEGPALFTIQSQRAGRLELGKLAARVPQQAHGFRIGTEQVSVIDLGTEFGVEVTESRTDTYVFEGCVSLAYRSPSGEEGRPQILNAGRGLRVSTDGPLVALDQAPKLNRRLSGSGLSAGCDVASYQFVGDQSDPRKAMHIGGYFDDNFTKLTDGRAGSSLHRDPAWVGWFDGKTDAKLPQPAIVFDLGQARRIHTVQAMYLVSHQFGIHAPDRVVVSVSEDGDVFSQAAEYTELENKWTAGNPDIRQLIAIDLAGQEARYVRLEFYCSQQWIFLSEVGFVTHEDP